MSTWIYNSNTSSAFVTQAQLLNGLSKKVNKSQLSTVGGNNKVPQFDSLGKLNIVSTNAVLALSPISDDAEVSMGFYSKVNKNPSAAGNYMGIGHNIYSCGIGKFAMSAFGYSSATPAICLDPASVRVGILTNAPTAPVHLNGNTAITGTATISSTLTTTGLHSLNGGMVVGTAGTVTYFNTAKFVTNTGQCNFGSGGFTSTGNIAQTGATSISTGTNGINLNGDLFIATGYNIYFNAASGTNLLTSTATPGINSTINLPGMLNTTPDNLTTENHAQPINNKTINSSSIGITTPAAGRFTTATADGEVVAGTSLRSFKLLTFGASLAYGTSAGQFIVGGSTTPTVFNAQGSDLCGKFTLRSGSAPVAGAIIFTYRYATNFNTDSFVTLTPGSELACTIMPNLYILSGVASFSAVLTSAASLAPSPATTYVFYWQVTGY